MVSHSSLRNSGAMVEMFSRAVPLINGCQCGAANCRTWTRHNDAELSTTIYMMVAKERVSKTKLYVKDSEAHVL